MLFNKDNKGSMELYGLSGTFQASADYKAVESEVLSATREVAMLVGSAVIARAEQLYSQDSLSDADQEWLDMVRRPIAFLAISNYARLTGLSHGETGRKIKVDDNEKVAFEWQIDRDDREMRERYFRSLDSLFNYLGDTDDYSWKESDLYKAQSATLIRSLAILEKVYPVNRSQYTYFMLVPLFLEAQETLSGIIGEERLASLLNGADEEGILDACRRWCVLKALILALSRWSIAAFPQEVARQFAPSYQGNKERRAATTDEIDWTLGKLRQQLSDTESQIRNAIEDDPYASAKLIPDNNPKKKYFTV